MHVEVVQILVLVRGFRLEVRTNGLESITSGLTQTVAVSRRL